jgi:DNA-binding response OmpR family regulator
VQHSPPSVLVVDDEPHIRSFLVDNLGDDDWIVHTAASAAHARSKLNAHSPDIILLDVGLPDASGFDLCREIREADALRSRFDPDVPVVMLTARTDDVDRVRSFKRGADDFVPKPLRQFFPYSVALASSLDSSPASHSSASSGPSQCRK